MHEYINVDNYFEKFFKNSDFVILSSHSHNPCITEIEEMIMQLNKRYYNVCSVFFTNHLNVDTSAIAQLNWHDKIVIENPFNPEKWEEQIKLGASYFAEMLINKANQY